MEKYTYNGETYYWNGNIWLDSSYTKVPIAIKKKLDLLLFQEEKLEDKSFYELMRMIDEAKKKEQNGLVLELTSYALGKASATDLKSLLPRAASLYRKMGQPNKAIEISKYYTDLYGRQIWSPYLLVSLAAAYCDIDDYETAKKFADITKETYGDEVKIALTNVYERIKNNE